MKVFHVLDRIESDAVVVSGDQRGLVYVPAHSHHEGPRGISYDEVVAVVEMSRSSAGDTSTHEQRGDLVRVWADHRKLDLSNRLMGLAIHAGTH